MTSRDSSAGSPVGPLSLASETSFCFESDALLFPVFQGHLWIDFQGTSNRYWVLLLDNELSYRDEKRPLLPIFRMSLRDARIDPMEEDTPDFFYAFKVETGVLSLTLAAQNANDRKRWLHALRASVEANSRNVPTPPLLTSCTVLRRKKLVEASYLVTLNLYPCYITFETESKQTTIPLVDVRVFMGDTTDFSISLPVQSDTSPHQFTFSIQTGLAPAMAALIQSAARVSTEPLIGRRREPMSVSGSSPWESYLIQLVIAAAESDSAEDQLRLLLPYASAAMQQHSSVAATAASAGGFGSPQRRALSPPPMAAPLRTTPQPQPKLPVFVESDLDLDMSDEHSSEGVARRVSDVDGAAATVSKTVSRVTTATVTVATTADSSVATSPAVSAVASRRDTLHAYTADHMELLRANAVVSDLKRRLQEGAERAIAQVSLHYRETIELREEITKLQAEHAEVDRQLKATQTSYSMQIAALQADMASHQQRADDLEDELMTSQRENEDFRRRLQTVGVLERKTRVATTQTESAELLAELQRALHDSVMNESAIAGVSVDESDSHVAHLTRALSLVEQQNLQLQGRLVNGERALQGAQKQLMDLQMRLDQIPDSDAKPTDTSALIAHLRKELHESEYARAKLEDEHEELHQQMFNCRETINRLSEQVKSSTLSELRQRLTSTEDQLRQCRVDLATAHLALVATESLNEELSVQISCSKPGTPMTSSTVYRPMSPAASPMTMSQFQLNSSASTGTLASPSLASSPGGGRMSPSANSAAAAFAETTRQLQLRLSASEEHVRALQQQLAAANDQIDDFVEQNKQSSTRTDQLQAHLEERRISIESDRLRLHQRLDTLSTALDEAQDDKQQLMIQLKTTETQLHEVTSKKRQLEGLVQQLQRHIAENAKENRELEEKLHSAEQQVVNMETLHKVIDDLQQDLEDAEHALVIAQRQIVTLQQKQRETAQQLDTRTREAAERLELAETAHARSLQDQNTQLTMAVDAVQLQIAQLQEYIAELESQLRASEGSNSQLQRLANEALSSARVREEQMRTKLDEREQAYLETQLHNEQLQRKLNDPLQPRADLGRSFSVHDITFRTLLNTTADSTPASTPMRDAVVVDSGPQQELLV
eukprot:TRINITY_DN11483_c0_g1_i1.p1 TRINITY_DN11483_c0_g1~~TRINITY_DN11483_c0_g1_i1.p1  ORF type:complete len:1120 (-),score=282.19 TRINITY_DN11483_c0_g1_i1:93-3452(-)